VGVVGAIVPWNWPFHNIINPISAAVMAGNAIVVKVSMPGPYSVRLCVCGGGGQVLFARVQLLPFMTFGLSSPGSSWCTAVMCVIILSMQHACSSVSNNAGVRALILEHWLLWPHCGGCAGSSSSSDVP
jgi:hypothetical protein